MNHPFLPPSGSPLSFLKATMAYGGIHADRFGVLAFYLVRLLLSYPSLLLHRFIFSFYINRVSNIEPPVFIIGHYRSGTSLMNKLLSADSRWRYISEYELLFPHHSKRIENILSPLIQRLINIMNIKHPNFNNYRINLNDPNEDEALLVSAGATWSSYWAFIFPSHSHQILKKTVSFEKDADKIIWINSYQHFLKRLLWKKSGHLLIKSPPNTARVEALLQLFPDAKFIYMHRNSDVVFRSMQRVWKEEVLKYFCLQKPDQAVVNSIISDMHKLLTESYQRDKAFIHENNLIEICYEKFLVDPYPFVESIYQKFQLPLADDARQQIQLKIIDQKNYSVATYSTL